MSNPYDMTHRQFEHMERRGRWISRGMGLFYLGLMTLSFVAGRLS